MTKGTFLDVCTYRHTCPWKSEVISAINSWRNEGMTDDKRSQERRRRGRRRGREEEGGEEEGGEEEGGQEEGRTEKERREEKRNEQEERGGKWGGKRGGWRREAEKGEDLAVERSGTLSAIRRAQSSSAESGFLLYCTNESFTGIEP